LIFARQDNEFDLPQPNCQFNWTLYLSNVMVICIGSFAAALSVHKVPSAESACIVLADADRNANAEKLFCGPAWFCSCQTCLEFSDLSFWPMPELFSCMKDCRKVTDVLSLGQYKEGKVSSQLLAFLAMGSVAGRIGKRPACGHHRHQGGGLMAGSTDDWRGPDNDDSEGQSSLQGTGGPHAHGSKSWDKTGKQHAQAEAKKALGDHESDLARTIEAEIIPRLLLTHLATKTIGNVRTMPERIVIEPVYTVAQIAEFSDLVRQKPLRAAIEHIDALLASGVTTEKMITEVLSPTAQCLGLQWEQDAITFVDVTLGLSRLQQLLRVYGPAFEADFSPKHEGRRILLVAMPGEQHTFGLAIVEEFFRRDGWYVQSEAGMSRTQLLNRVRDEWLDVVGLSASGDASMALLTPLIQAIRDASTNRHIRVIVGGCAFLAEPKNALALGADLVACNGREAVLNVERLLDPKKSMQ
jgi:MerR family transcriptional regulator, light-induced transcriptional regulator